MIRFLRPAFIYGLFSNFYFSAYCYEKRISPVVEGALSDLNLELRYLVVERLNDIGNFSNDTTTLEHLLEQVSVDHQLKFVREFDNTEVIFRSTEGKTKKRDLIEFKIDFELTDEVITGILSKLKCDSVKINMFLEGELLSEELERIVASKSLGKLHINTPYYL